MADRHAPSSVGGQLGARFSAWCNRLPPTTGYRRNYLVNLLASGRCSTPTPHPSLKRKAGMAATSRSGGRLSGWDAGLVYSAYCLQCAFAVSCLFCPARCPPMLRPTWPSHRFRHPQLARAVGVAAAGRRCPICVIHGWAVCLFAEFHHAKWKSPVHPVPQTIPRERHLSVLDSLGEILL